MGHTEVVGEIYAAFGRGDVPAILEQLADDVAWESWADNSAVKAGVPWLQPRTSRDDIPGFFEVVGAIGITRFEVLDLMGSGHQVAAEIELDWGDGYSDQQLHLWTFGDGGKVVRFRHYVDTAKHMAAAGIG
jgi:ketosteroid isomerase-like protein